MKNIIEILDYPSAKIGWHSASKVNEHLGKINSKIPFLYLHETGELVILDESLVTIMRFLQITYRVQQPSQAIKYIKEDA